MTDIENAIACITRQVEVLEQELSTLKTEEYIQVYKFDIANKKLAIEALQEKAEREKGCEWCDYFAKSENLISLGNGQYKEVPHKYCGNCGKEL